MVAPPDAMRAKEITDAFRDDCIDAVFGLSIGHGKWNHSVSVGVRATADANKPALTITESALD